MVRTSGTRYALCRFLSRRIYLVPHHRGAGYLSSRIHDATGPVKRSGRLLDSVFPGKVLVRTLRISSSKDDCMPTGSIRQRISLYTIVARRDAGAAKNINYTLVPMSSTGKIELVQSRVYVGGNVRVVVPSLFFVLHNGVNSVF